MRQLMRGLAVLVAVCVAASASAQPQNKWMSYQFGGVFADAQVKMLTDWINDFCRPDEMSHISGLSYQSAPRAYWNLEVFCRRGGSGQLGKVKVVKTRYNNRAMFQFQSEFAQQNSAVILGFNIESAPSGQGDATGDVVMIVKE